MVILTLTLLWACAAPPPAPTPAAPTQVPWRTATDADVHPLLRALAKPGQASCCVVQLDLDGSGALDEARLEIDDQTGAVRLRLTVGGEVVDGPALSQAPAGVPTRVMTAMWTTVPGPLLREYATDAHRKAAALHPAVVVCQAPRLDAAGVPEPLDDSLVCYCEDWLMWEDGKLLVHHVCD